MRSALRRNPSRSQVAQGASLIAFTGGWDAQHALAEMPAGNAVQMDNIIPRAGYAEVRRGFAAHVTGIGQVETLMVYRGAASDQIFAATGAEIIDVTAAGSAGSTLHASASSAQWQWTNFSNAAGRFLIAVNGVDTPQKFNGTAFSDTAITGAGLSSSSLLVDVMSHKERLFFIEKGALRVWYLDVNAIAGTASLLDLGGVFNKGGALAACATWTLDGGQGADDYAVFITELGEVAIYQGTDPSDPDNWALVGVFEIGLPLGRRCAIKYGSDLICLTTDGVTPLSQALRYDRARANQAALTARIQNAFAVSAQAYGRNFGWQAMLYPKASLAIINVPTLEFDRSEQYVQNLQTGAWCRFTGIDAACWALANDDPYFGGKDGVYRFDVGSSDGGEDLVADLLGAFNYFGSRGRLKKFDMIRPLTRQSQSVPVALEVVTDYRHDVPIATPSPGVLTGGLWGVALWGSGEWSDALQSRYNWTNVSGLGYCGAVRARAALNSATPIDLQFLSFDLLFQGGGQI